MAKSNPELKEQFGFVVRTRRNSMGISQEELAGRSGLHRTYIADIERGARNPSLASIDRLARALEISIGALFSSASNTDGKGEKPSKEIPREPVDILLVEDNPGDVALTLRAFERANLTNRIHVAKDGEEALAYIFSTGAYAGNRLEHRPKVILLDLGLPKINGIEVLRRVKSDERTQMIPVVVLTVSDQERDVAECRRLGAETYIIKPVDFQRFCQVTPKLKFSWVLLKQSIAA